MIYIVGSGPAGVSCATALLNRGYKITMLDAGIELEQDKKNKIAQQQPIKHALNEKNLVKLSYGSDFPYREVSKHIAIEMDDEIHCMPSFAKGGLSNVWGAFVEKYHDTNMTSWPIKPHQLNPYYDKIFKLLNITTNTPDLNPDYQPSNQTKKILSHLSLHQEHLQQAGFNFSLPTLAVNFNKCVYCGVCQHGCPRELIYSSTHTLNNLLKNSNFTYMKDIVVDNLTESEHAITLHSHNRLTTENINFNGTQAFLACGPIISTYLVLKATMNYSEKIEISESSHFMFPCLLKDRVKNVSKENLHTLCQVSLKLNKPSIADHPVNLQVYTYMDHYSEKFRQFLKGSYRFVSPLLNHFIDRLVIIQGHLDSQESHKFYLQLNDDHNGVKLSSHLNPAVNLITKKLMQHLKSHKQHLGLLPIASILKISKIGKSFHYGASLPMRTNPKELETDIYGRPFGLKRLHVVDASIFPSIPAGSITPTIMANAYRIASESPVHE